MRTQNTSDEPPAIDRAAAHEHMRSLIAKLMLKEDAARIVPVHLACVQSSAYPLER